MIEAIRVSSEIRQATLKHIKGMVVHEEPTDVPRWKKFIPVMWIVNLLLIELWVSFGITRVDKDGERLYRNDCVIGFQAMVAMLIV